MRARRASAGAGSGASRGESRADATRAATSSGVERDARATPPTPAQPKRQNGDPATTLEPHAGVFAAFAKSPNGRFILAGTAIVLAVLIFIVVAATQGPKTLNLSDYVEVTYDGYDGYGLANASMDWEGLYNALWAAAQDRDYDFDLLVFRNGASGIVCNAENNHWLSNGDVVTITFDADEDAFESLGVKLSAQSLSVEVSGLEPVTEFDPFDGVNVEFTGLDGSGELEISGGNNHGIGYSADKRGGLSNGDVVTITAVSGTEGDKDGGFMYYTYFEGLRPSTVSKQFTVSGLGTKLTTLDSSMSFGDLDAVARDDLETYQFSSFASTNEVTDVTLVAEYLLQGDDPGASQGFNTIVLAYRVTITDGAGGRHPYYTFVTYGDAFEDDNGNVSVPDYAYSGWPSARYTFSGRSSPDAEREMTYSCRGYETLDEMRDGLSQPGGDYTLIAENMVEE